jgi:phenylalanyl-tRNA synthetase alpha chain
LELTYNEKRLLAVLKPLKDAENARKKALEPISETVAVIRENDSLGINPLRDILSMLEETKNIAITPV